MKIFSKEWLEASRDAINNNPDYKEAASWWDGDLLCIIEPSGPLENEIRFFLGLLHGECTDVRLLKEGEQPEVEFTFAGPYDNWKMIVKNELDTIQAVMSGKLKLTGNMPKLMRGTRAAQEIIRSLQTVPTEYL